MEPIRTGLWKKAGQNGNFYSGAVVIDGEEFWVNLYNNDRKTADNQPDLNLVLKYKGPAVTESAQHYSEDIAF